MPKKAAKPTVYVGCLPCAKGRMCSTLEQAQKWQVRHWKACSRTSHLEALSH